MSSDPTTRRSPAEGGDSRNSKAPVQLQNEARVDTRPHSHAPSFTKRNEETEEPQVEDQVLAALGMATEDSPGQFTRHAEQLVDWIRRRQDDLDQREANINALAASLELEQRKLRLDQDAATENAAADSAWNDLKATVAESKRVQNGLDRQRELIDSDSSCEPQELNEHRRTLENDRRQLEREIEDFERQRNAWRKECDQKHDVWTNEVAEERRQIQSLREYLLNEKNVLRDAKDKVVAQHQELLHLQLAVQQLWNQVNTRRNPLELTEALAQIRQRIAENYQWQQEDLAERRHALKDLASHLAAAQEKVSDDRREVDNWIRQRNEELENEAARVISRERELQLKERNQQRLQRDWEQERRELQQTIRDLKDRLKAD